MPMVRVSNGGTSPTEQISFSISDNGSGSANIAFPIELVKLYSIIQFRANTSNANLYIDGVRKGYSVDVDTSTIQSSCSVNVPDSATFTLIP